MQSKEKVLLVFESLIPPMLVRNLQVCFTQVKVVTFPQVISSGHSSPLQVTLMCIHEAFICIFYFYYRFKIFAHAFYNRISKRSGKEAVSQWQGASHNPQSFIERKTLPYYAMPCSWINPLSRATAMDNSYDSFAATTLHIEA